MRAATACYAGENGFGSRTLQRESCCELIGAGPLPCQLGVLDRAGPYRLDTDPLLYAGELGRIPTKPRCRARAQQLADSLPSPELTGSLNELIYICECVYKLSLKKKKNKKKIKIKNKK